MDITDPLSCGIVYCDSRAEYVCYLKNATAPRLTLCYRHAMAIRDAFVPNGVIEQLTRSKTNG